jgi:hypothetical protein
MNMQGDYECRKFDFIINWIASWIGKETLCERTALINSRRFLNIFCSYRNRWFQPVPKSSSWKMGVIVGSRETTVCQQKRVVAPG